MPRTKRPIIKRLPPNNIFIGGYICFFLIAIVALVYLAINAVMGGSQYLYHKEGEENNSESSSSSVIEYLGNEGVRPHFLYKPDDRLDFEPGPRVVEFYAPWCPHCQHYAPKYKALAKEAMAAQPSVKFYAVSCVAHKDICKAQGVNSYPTVKFFQKGSYEKVDLTLKGVNNDANKMLYMLGFDKGSGGKDIEGHAKDGEDHKKKKEIARVIPFRDHDVHDAWQDASTSFEFALKNGIYMENGPLSSTKSKAFKEWLDLLSKSLPNEMSRTHDLINAILYDFDKATHSQKNLDQIVKDNLPESQHPDTPHKWTWRTCTYGDNSMGYTCGLWQLFHIMSVGVVEYNRHNHPAIATRYASETLRNYIDHFFQCDVCRMNFLDMYDNCAFDGCHRLSESPSLSEHEWKEFPMWLWETHNDVNTRLLGERLEQNKEDKPSQWETQQARWPSLFACPNCWREDRSWEEEEVFKHLDSLYRTGNPSYIKIPSEDSVGVGGSSSRFPLRWKVSAIILVVAAILTRLSNSKKVRHFSGKHKK